MKFTNELRGVKSRLLLFSVLLLIPVMMFAQSITVKGTVPVSYTHLTLQTNREVYIL